MIDKSEIRRISMRWDRGNEKAANELWKVTNYGRVSRYNRYVYLSFHLYA